MNSNIMSTGCERYITFPSPCQISVCVRRPLILWENCTNSGTGSISFRSFFVLYRFFTEILQKKACTNSETSSKKPPFLQKKGGFLCIKALCFFIFLSLIAIQINSVQDLPSAFSNHRTSSGDNSSTHSHRQMDSAPPDDRS